MIKMRNCMMAAIFAIGGASVFTSCVNSDNPLPNTTAHDQWQAGRTVTAEAVAAYGGIDKCFAAEPIPDDVWERMQGKTFTIRVKAD